ncbi:hypothetical protein [Bradyrhizobium tunisiense]|uniref:hypothetical protein n=1 Tax=Bradyrhizobium tunisiense TaxID=3278709 RepID=UPI0035DF6E87
MIRERGFRGIQLLLLYIEDGTQAARFQKQNFESEGAVEIFLAVVALVVGGYFFLNWKRNSDPLNRKCAAEICEYVTSAPQINVEDIHAIFMRNARYRAQANHVLSMVPALLIRAGYPKDASMGVVPILRAAAAIIPR